MYVPLVQRTITDLAPSPTQVVGPATWALLELLAPHLEQLVVSDWNGLELLGKCLPLRCATYQLSSSLYTAGDRKDDRLVFGCLATLTLRAHPRPLIRGLDDFLSKCRVDELRAITLCSPMMLRSRSDFLTMHRRLPRDSSMLEQVVLDAGLPRLQSVTVVAEAWGLSGRGIVEKLEEQMPAVVRGCREKLSSLHQRGLLRVAGAILGELVLLPSV